MEDEAAATAKERELAQWVEFAGEASSTGTEAPLIKDVGCGDAGLEGEEGQGLDGRSTPGEHFEYAAGGGPSPGDPEDVDTVIEEVARDAAAEADKIAAEESAKAAAEEAAKGSAEETGKTAAEEAGEGPAGEAGKATAEEGAVDDQPSSSFASGSGRYLRAKSRKAVEDKGEADLEERVAEAQARFRQAHKDLKSTQDVLAERNLELVMKQADIEKAQELVEQQAAQAEAARHQQQAALNSQEEDLAAREEKLVATLHGKDGEVEKLLVQRT
nr:translation initiation factor IF-2-like [Aegilops tauschii subsp. strangulata]